MPRISEEMRYRVIIKMQEEANQKKVARDLNMCRCTVRKIWLKFLKTNTVSDLKKSGRPCLLSERGHRDLVILAKKSPFCGPLQLVEGSKCYPSMCRSTIQRYLRKSGLYGRKAAKKPMLTEEHMKRRLNWCKAYSNFTEDMWLKVMFSDESQIQRFTTHCRHVRRPVGARFQNRYVCKTVKYGGISILCWGAILGDGTRTIVRCPPRLNSEAYQDVLDVGIRDMYKEDNIFMHDGAPCHRSRQTKAYLDRKKVCVLSDWPSQSPDLNPIENLWATLKKNVSRRHASNKEELWHVIVEEWHKVPNNSILSLYRSMPQRLASVIKSKGSHSKY